MKFKTNLHFHTNDDPHDKGINYTFLKGIDGAKELGFDILALTCHKKSINIEEYEKYAKKNGILLISGVELNIENCHVLILNTKKDIEIIKTFSELRKYKKEHPEIFIIAPHPFFYGNYSLKNELEIDIDLFDAIEHSWFYSKQFNRNKKGEKIAQKYSLPFIASSDTHDLWGLDKDYAIIEMETKNIASVFKAIREKKFENITRPKKLWREMVFRHGMLSIRNLIRRIF
ncbi:MAG: PHP-associated domain-containing protein [Patescibacteria group bacterium]|nr:PHP-associated domain-containing protein [Patescibacteria group bacterium]